MGYKYVLNALVTLFISLSLVGCNGGLNCPIDTPSCCDNVLFGCGVFDLPFGCSCDQYGRFLSTNVAALKSVSAAKSTPSPGLNGNWSGILRRSSASCSGFLQEARGMLHVTTGKKRTVNVLIPGYGTLKGRRLTGGYRVSGTYSLPRSSCRANIVAKFKKTRNAAGNISARIFYSCRAYTCSVKYAGAFQKQ